MIRLTRDVISAMIHICSCSPRKIFSFSLGTDQAAVLGSAAEDYVLYQLDRSFSTLDFYNSIRRLYSEHHDS